MVALCFPVDGLADAAAYRVIGIGGRGAGRIKANELILCIPGIGGGAGGIGPTRQVAIGIIGLIGRGAVQLKLFVTGIIARIQGSRQVTGNGGDPVQGDPVAGGIEGVVRGSGFELITFSIGNIY